VNDISQSSKEVCPVWYLEVENMEGQRARVVYVDGAVSGEGVKTVRESIKTVRSTVHC
jgi:hypothetical protein